MRQKGAQACLGSPLGAPPVTAAVLCCCCPDNMATVVVGMEAYGQRYH